jgi:putative addiction module killer protein
MPAYEIEHYVTPNGKDLYQSWHDRLRDGKARVVIERRINRLVEGNFIDHKHCRDGVWELRIDIGPGYRVYYGLRGARIVLLLCGATRAPRVWTSIVPCGCGSRCRRSGNESHAKP